MSLRTARLVAGAAAVGIAVSGIAPAHAADPSGTLTLASGPSAYHLAYAPLVHTGLGTVFESSSGASVIVSDAGSPSTFSLASSYLTSACGDLVISAFPLDNEPFTWTDVSTGATGHAQVSTGRFLLGATPDGWLETEDATSDGTAVAEVHRRYTSGSDDDLIASIPDPTDTTASPFLGSHWYTCDTAGYAVTAFNASGSSVIVGSFGGGFTRLADDAGYVELHPVAISGQTVVYGQDTYDENLSLLGGRTMRQTVGQPATVLNSAGTVTTAAIGPSSTAYAVASLTTRQVTLRVRSDAGVTSTPTQPGAWSPWLAWPAAGGFGVAAYGGAGGGVYAVTGAAVSYVWAPTGGSLSASALSLSAGRAVWADDRQTTSPVWSAPVTGTSALTKGQETGLGTNATLGGDLVADGRRTAWADIDAERLQVTDGTTVTGLSTQGSPIAFSGHRILDVPGLTTTSTHIVDLVSGLTVSGGSATVMWGERAAGIVASSGSIAVLDARTGATTQTITASEAGVPSGGEFDELALEGDLLAWTWTKQSASTTHGAGWKDLRTGTVTQAALTDPTYPVTEPTVYGSLVAVDRVLSAQVYDASTGDVVRTVDGADHPVLGEVGLAWVDRGTREPKVSPMPDQHLVPRHEGNPVAPTSYADSLGSWQGEWVFTEPLTSCQVSITAAGGASVATLPCADRYAAQGEAVVAWDGTVPGGSLAPTGTYHWTLTASDADGPAVDVDGLSTTLTGTITVTATSPGYVSMTPSRILDTRIGNGAPRSRVPSGGTLQLKVAGRGGVPADGVDAVVLNLTVTDAPAGGYVTAYPSGAVRPTASSLNYVKNTTIANQVIAKVGAGGQVALYVRQSTHLIADVEGYYPTGAAYTSLAPSRILDTREGLGASAGKVGTGTQVSLKVTELAGVPDDAVAVAVTVTQPSPGGYVTVYPDGTPRPTASNINVTKGRTIAGLVLAKVGATGKVNLYTSTTAHLVADVVGWVPAHGDYHALNPARLLDTRTGNGGVKAKVAGRHAVTVKVTGRGGVPGTATTVMLNVAAVVPDQGGHLTVYPGGASRPTASNLNFTRRRTIANSVVAKVGSGGYVTIYTSSTTNLVADVSGYWEPVPPG